MPDVPPPRRGIHSRTDRRCVAPFVVAMLVVAVAAGADEFGLPPGPGEPRVVLTPWIGYGAAGMQEARVAMGLASRDLSGGVCTGLDAGFRPVPAAQVLVRAGYRSAGSVVAVTHRVRNDDFGGAGTLQTVEDARHKAAASVVPLEVGVRYVQTVQQAVEVSIAVFAGAGLGRLVFGYDDVTTESGTGLFAGSRTTRVHGTVPLSGVAPAAEGVFGVAWKVNDHLSLGLEGGYLYARVGRMTVARDVDLTGDRVADVEAGDPFEDADGKAIPVDFSGGSIAVRLSLAFGGGERPATIW